MATTISPGEILCLKTTGEKVFVLSITGEVATVRRPFIGESGVFKHSTENFQTNELETLREHMARQVDEMLEKGEAQKTLMRAERKLNEELENELVEDNKVVPFSAGTTGSKIN